MDGPQQESWVERVIREAGEAGEFDDLLGHGKPIPRLDRPYESTWWARTWMERDRRNHAVTALAAKLRRELPRLMAGADPNVIRAGLRNFNEQIAAVNDGIPDDDKLPVLDIDRLMTDRR
jgi:hypothetical protein